LLGVLQSKRDYYVLILKNSSLQLLLTWVCVYADIGVTSSFPLCLLVSPLGESTRFPMGHAQPFLQPSPARCN